MLNLSYWHDNYQFIIPAPTDLEEMCLIVHDTRKSLGGKTEA